jgi:hypothetical protein
VAQPRDHWRAPHLYLDGIVINASRPNDGTSDFNPSALVAAMTPTSATSGYAMPVATNELRRGATRGQGATGASSGRRLVKSSSRYRNCVSRLLRRRSSNATADGRSYRRAIDHLRRVPSYRSGCRGVSTRPLAKVRRALVPQRFCQVAADKSRGGRPNAEGDPRQ